MMKNFISTFGHLLLRFTFFLGSLSLLLGQTLYWSCVPPFRGERFFKQAKRVGPESFFITSLVAFFIGVILALQMAYMMQKLSSEIYIPSVIAVSLCRELAPVITALIVAGRIGAGITAEIGSMTVTEQVDALRAFATNPVRYLVVPRFWALAIMLPVLTIFADLIGIMGGFMICVFKLSISPAMYWTMATESIAVKDVFTGLIKTIFFGMIIALVGCQQGLKTKGGAEGVGRATTISVVTSFIFIIMTDGFFTAIFYFVFRS